MDEEGIDLEILGVFLEEAAEAMGELDARFVALEDNPKDREAVDAIFRVVHTIKGNAAFFGLMQVKRLAHQMEDLLALMREAQISVTPPRVNALLKGIDLVRAMLDAVRAGENEVTAVDSSEVEALGNALVDMCDESSGESSGLAFVLNQLDHVLASTGDLQVIREKLKVARANIAEKHKTAMGEDPAAGNAAPLSTHPRPALDSLIELLSAAPQEDLTPEQAAQANELLTAVEAQATAETKALAEKLRADHDAMVGSVGFVALLREILLEGARAMKAVEPASEAEAPKAAKRRETTARTMRVEESKIDQFLDYVGDLIIVREMFVNVGKRVREHADASQLASDYQHALEAFSLLSHSLQDSIMEVRKVSIKGVMQKVPRMARDLAAVREKEVKVETHGENATVDKSLLESLEGPLTHMVRNAVDHGIEPPDVREARGKPRHGTLVVRAHEDREYIRIDVSDDGGGIDAEKLKRKATSLGLITEHQANRMQQEEAFELLFAPGLSTAEKVTDISGRGVGMDVVRRNVTELGGDIKISSELGVGTTFTLMLPKAVTVQILDGFLVRVNGERFILPLQSIKESFRPEGDHVVTVAERGEFISRRGQVLPLLRFGEVLALGELARRAPSDSIVVSVDVSGKGSAGLLVDEVLGVQQVVLREVHGIDASAAPFAGGAVLGDGRVAMVVDVDRLGGLVHA